MCAACGRQGTNAHHFIPKGGPYHGDDAVANIVIVCGSGTAGCHGAIHGSPYVDRAGRRWTERDVRDAIGRHVLAHRPDVIRYATGKLGDRAADFLERRYGIGTA